MNGVYLGHNRMRCSWATQKQVRALPSTPSAHFIFQSFITVIFSPAWGPVRPAEVMLCRRQQKVRADADDALHLNQDCKCGQANAFEDDVALTALCMRHVGVP